MKRYVLKESVIEALRQMGQTDADIALIDMRFNEADESTALIKTTEGGMTVHLWRVDVCKVVEVESVEPGVIYVFKEVQDSELNKKRFPWELIFSVLITASVLFCMYALIGELK